MMTCPEVFILPDPNVVRGAILEFFPTADLEVVTLPDVARLELTEFLTAAAGKRGRDGGQKIKPVV
jgi:hypothetical protein